MTPLRINTAPCDLLSSYTNGPRQNLLLNSINAFIVGTQAIDAWQLCPLSMVTHGSRVTMSMVTTGQISVMPVVPNLCKAASRGTPESFFFNPRNTNVNYYLSTGSII